MQRRYDFKYRQERSIKMDMFEPKMQGEVAMKIEFTQFKGIMPRYADKMLPDDAATIAKNVELLGGKILPLSDVTLPVDNLGVFTVQGPIVDDQFDRSYSTDGAGPLTVSTGTAVFPIPAAPVGSSVSVFDNIITEDVVGLILAALGDESEMEFISLDDGDTADTQLIVFRYPGEASATSKIYYQNPYYQLQINEEQSLPDSFSTSPSDGTNIEIRSDKNEIVSRYFIEDYTIVDTFPVDNPGGLPFTRDGYDIQFVITNKYIDSIKDNYYVYRFVDATGAEGPPSELSAIITRYPGEIIQLTTLPTATGMVTVRIYRSAGVEEAAGFYFVGDALAGAATFDDDIDTADLAEIMPPFGNPPDTPDNLTLCSGGFMAVNSGKDIYFCDPYLPSTWQYTNAVNVPDTIIAMASRRNALLVMTDVKLHMFAGNDPANMLPVELAFNQPCLAQQSVVKIDGNVFYASDDGLCMVSNAGFSIVTRKTFRQSDWLALVPSGFIAAEYNNKYIALTGSGDYIIVDVNEGFITTYSGGGSAEWQSKVFVMAKIVSFNMIKVIAADYPVTVEFIADGSSVLTMTITDNNPRRIPILRNELEWQFKITSAYRVDSMVLATSGEEI